MIKKIKGSLYLLIDIKTSRQSFMITAKISVKYYLKYILCPEKSFFMNRNPFFFKQKSHNSKT